MGAWAQPAKDRGIRKRFCDTLVLDEGNDAHRAVALGAGEGLYFTDYSFWIEMMLAHIRAE